MVRRCDRDFAATRPPRVALLGAMRTLRRSCAAALGAVLALGACSHGKRGSAFVTPIQQEVAADRITLTGTAPEGTATVTAGDVVASLGADRTFWARNVPLVPGENQIQVVATDVGGRELRRETVRILAVRGPDPVGLELDPPSGSPPLAVRLHVVSPLDVAEARFDVDGDGEDDASGTQLDLTHTYESAGHHAPQVTIRTRAGLYFSSLRASPLAPDPLVVILPEPVVEGSSTVVDPQRILATSDGSYLVLSRRAREIVTLGPELDVRGRIALRGLDDPSGLAVDARGRFLLCDAARHRLVRLTRTGALDTSFAFQGFVGEAGTGPLQFQRPADVALDEEENVYVADTGNRRIQKLNQEGVFVAEFALPGEPSRVEFARGGLHYVLTGSRELAVLDVLGTERRRFSASGRGAVRSINVLAARGVLATTTDGEPTVWLQALGGRGRRALHVPELTGARHVALAQRPQSLELVVVDASERVLRIKVPEDEPGAGPAEVVRAMLQLLASGELEGALQLFHPEVRDRYRRQLARLTPEQRAAMPARIEVGDVALQSAHQAEVAVAVDTGAQRQDDVVGLDRDGDTFAWRITAF